MGDRTRPGLHAITRQVDRRHGLCVRERTASAGLRDAPAGLGALDLIFAACDAFRPVVGERRRYAKPRQDLIAVTPALRERELAKISALGEAVSGALRERNIPPLHADPAGQIGMAFIAHATAEWLDDDSVGLAERFRLVRKALAELFG